MIKIKKKKKISVYIMNARFLILKIFIINNSAVYFCSEQVQELREGKFSKKNKFYHH